MARSADLWQAVFWGTGPFSFNLFTVAVLYFLCIWLVKLVASRFYRPCTASFSAPTTVVVSAYHESPEVLTECVRRVLAHDPAIVRRVLIVTDEREPQCADWCARQWPEERVRVLVSAPGKRAAVRLGIERAETDFVVLFDSDTFASPGAIDELLKVFCDPAVGGAEGDQLIFNPFGSLLSLYAEWAQLIEFRYVVPAMSLFGCVTVLGGRCMALRRAAVLPLLDSLTGERFFGRPCISGDDGRMTSLLLHTGWKCVYQRTAQFRTVAPPTPYLFYRQRLRWFRNSARRTIRGLCCFREPLLPRQDRAWAWRRPVIALHMLSMWLGVLCASVVNVGVLAGIATDSIRFTGSPLLNLVTRVTILLVIGAGIRKLIRCYPAIRDSTNGRLVYIFLYPLFSAVVWFIRVHAILTMNVQGWLTRRAQGPGGFG